MNFDAKNHLFVLFLNNKFQEDLLWKTLRPGRNPIRKDE
jgi:hypothetical protein